MRKFILAAAAAFWLTAQAGAVCTTLGTGLGLKLPNFGDRGDVWAKCVRDNFQAMNDGLLPSTAAVNYVLKATPEMSGGLVSSSWATFVGSVTASGAFYGSGAGLTAIPSAQLSGTIPTALVDLSTPTAAIAGKVSKAGDFMTGQLTTTSSMTAQHVYLANYANPSLIFQGNNVNNGGELVYRRSDDGTDYEWKLWHGPSFGDQLYLYRKGPAAVQTWTQTGLVGLGNVAPAHALDVTGDIRATSTMTASAYYGDGATLTGIIQSTATGTYALSTTGNAATATTATNNVLKTGDTMSGQLTINGDGSFFPGVILNQAGVWRAGFWYDTNNSITMLGGGNFGEGLMYKRATGRVGLDTLAPTHKLHVTGDGLFTSSVTATGGLYGNLTGDVTGLASLNLPLTGGTLTGPLTLAGSSLTVTGSAFSVGTSTFVVTGGKVGVGTNSPAELVHAVGSFRADAGGGIYANFSYNTARAYGTDWYQDIGTVGKHFYLRTSNAGSLDTTAMTVLNTGSVGIGTTSPASKLHVQDGVVLSSTTSGFGAFTGYGSSGGCLMFRDTDNAGWTECKFLDGTMSCATDADGVCD